MKKIKNFLTFVLIFGILLLSFPVDVLAQTPQAAETAKIETEKREPAPPKSGKIELTDKRTINSKTYLKSDGSKELVTSLKPMHYQDMSDGMKWKDIDINLHVNDSISAENAAAKYSNGQNDFIADFSSDIGQKMFSINKNESIIDLKPKDVQKRIDIQNLNLLGTDLESPLSLMSGNKITHKNVYPDIDFIIYSLYDGVKEDIVIKKYNDKNTFKFDLNIDNARFEKIADGSYKFFRKDNGQYLFTMPRFLMWDSKGGKTSEQNAYSYNVKSEIIENGGKYEVVITADENWLSSKDRVFPVTLDPSFSANLLEDTYIQTGYPTTQAWDQRALYVGQGATKGLMRSLVLFNIPVPDLQGARILSSRFDVFQYANCSGMCQSAGVIGATTTAFNPWDTTWNNRPVELARAGSSFNNTTWGWFSMDITSAAIHWIYNNYDGSIPGGLEFIQDGEINWGFRTWVSLNNPDYPWGAPKLTIDYNDYNAAYYPTDVPTMTAGSTVDVPITVVNTGRNTWYNDQFNIAYHWVNNATGETIIFDGNRGTLPKNVGPRGDYATAVVKVSVPPNSGSYTLKWDMVHEWVTWFSQQGVPTLDKTVTVSPPSFASMHHLGMEKYYVKAGPVDLATGNLSFTGTDMSIPSTAGLLSFSRSYNSKSTIETFYADQEGYIKTWLFNGLYKENDQNVRLIRSYIGSEDKVRPSLGSSSNGNLWISGTENDNRYINIHSVLASAKASQYGATTNSAIYAHVYVYSPSARNVQLKLGSDDGIQVRLNGNEILSNDVYRGITLDADVVNTTLKKGWNRLLLKVTQGGVDWNMSARFTKPGGSPFNDLKYSLDNPEVFDGSALLSKGWTTSVEEKLYISDPDNIYYRDATGTVNIYSKNNAGQFVKPAGSSEDLIINADNTYSLISKSGSSTNFTPNGRIKNRSDLSGNKLFYEYDAGKCVRIRDGNRAINLVYSGDKLIEINDGQGNSYLYLFEPMPNNESIFWLVVDPYNQALKYEYDGSRKLISFMDKKGNKTSINYLGDKVSAIIDTFGNKTSINYSDKTTEITDALGRKSSVSFDYSNLLTLYTNEKGYSEAYIYDSRYNLTSTTPVLPENDLYYYKWSYVYDSNDNLISQTDPEGIASANEYSGNDLVKTTDPDGNVQTYSFSTDGRRLLLSKTDPKGNLTTYQYDNRGRIILVKDPKGAATKYSYSADSDVILITAPKGEKTAIDYDALGRKINETSPVGKVTTYKYDKLSRLISMIDAGGLKVIYRYDVNDNIIKIVNPNGTTKTFGYNALDRLVRVVDEAGAKISHRYDAVGNKIKTVDAKGKETRFEYDELDRLIKTIDPAQNVTTIEYDRNGNPIKVTDSEGTSTETTFNKRGEATQIKNQDGTADLAYDKNGNVTNFSYSVKAEKKNISYDNNGNVTVIDSNVSGKTTKAYDQNNNQTSVATSTSTINFGYNANQELTQISSTLNQTGKPVGSSNLINDAEGKLITIEKANGDITSQQYDLSGRIISTETKNKNGVILASLTYVYDLASNATSIIDNVSGKTISYEYDGRNQLLKDNIGRYTYDIMGNRTTMVKGDKTTTYTYDEAGDANRLIKINHPDDRITDFEYDKNGNVIKKINSQYGTTEYTYDSDNYFIKAVVPNGSSVEYIYDKASKLRVERIEKDAAGNETITKFTYDGDRLVSETDKDGKVLLTYTWDDQENLISVAMSDGSGNFKTYYYIKNAKGDIIGLSDKNGDQVVKYNYDSWGKVIKSETIGTSVPANLDKLNPRLYGGYWYDDTIGLYFMKTRMYDPSIGRFLSKDTSGTAVSALDYNPYLYCNNNPITRIDPSGKSWFSWLLQKASNVVNTLHNGWHAAGDWVGEQLGKFADIVGPTLAKIPGASWLAEKVGQLADWTGGRVGRTIFAGIAIGVGAAFTAVAVSAAITYVAGLGTYGAISGGAGYSTYNAVRNALGSPGAGNQWHHIVEQSQILRSGFSSFMVNNSNNLIVVSQKTHQQISSLYSSQQYYSEGMTVRGWLTGQSFQQQYEFGIQILRQFGAFK